MTRTIRKILIANRGEIAVRVIRTARNMGIKTVAVYSEIDADSLHVALADEAWSIGEIELADTYLNIPKIIDITLRTGCDAIHPGYGFLAENPLFAEACAAAGILFIGPEARTMRIMGNKIAAREFVAKTGIQMTAGVTGTPEELAATAHRIGFPVLLKAAAGGGGKGMRIVHHSEELPEAIEATMRQAKAYFSDETVYIEKFIEEPRHIEIQVLGDHHGNVIHLFERECSIQRRYQKIIEESPSPTLTPEVRRNMGEAAVAIGKAIGYTNAGTIEFLVDRDLNFYFLEMNTRIQVEHPVTEQVTGIDLVEEQIRIAAGEPLRVTQEEVRQQGHAIECRIYAEDPTDDFRPSPGKMTLYHEPYLPGIRIDTGITADTEIKSSFDPMIGKLVTLGKDRPEAAQTMLRALGEYTIQGIRTNIPYLVSLLQSEAFSANRITTRFCDAHTASISAAILAGKKAIPLPVPIIAYLMYTLKREPAPGLSSEPLPSLWERIGFWRNHMAIKVHIEDTETEVYIPSIAGPEYRFRIGETGIAARLLSLGPNRIGFSEGHRHHTAWISEGPGGTAFVTTGGHTFSLKRQDLLTEMVFASGFDTHGHDSNHLTSPMPGKVIRVMAKAGDAVGKGDPLLIIEAMKMENVISAPRDAGIIRVNVSDGERVDTSTVLIELSEGNL